ncbi:MAG TPA: TetR family transcriptional regulator, partial [Gemmatimonadales bacterium]|nr:TetR family transcriptional regulator [Gemmatimonadales bacterium]
MASPLPRSRDADRSRSAILDAAESLFAQQGYRPTSLADVGERAGVSRGTPGYFFGSKEQLYRAVLDRCFADALDVVRTGRVRAERSDGTREEILAGAVSDYVDYAVAHPDFVRLIHREALGEGPESEPNGSGMAVGLEAVNALAEELG